MAGLSLHAPGTDEIPPFQRIAIPIILGVVILGLWEWACRAFALPPYIVPSPSAILHALIVGHAILLQSLWVTFRVTFLAFVCALGLGVGGAIVFSESRLVEASLFPYAVILQVTPVMAIAPLIQIWVGLDNAGRANLILATIVAFFPILSNTTLGLKSVDHNLRALFELHGVSRWRRLWLLELPSALPYLLAGMKISGGLALIGAVVAEFVSLSGTSTGLAWRILESSNRLDIPRLFAALMLLSALGIVIFFALSALERLLLRRWHESAVRREG